MLGEKAADDGDRVCAGRERLQGPFARDAADGDERAFGEPPQTGELIKAHHGAGLFLGRSGEDGAQREVIAGLGCSVEKLPLVVCRESDGAFGTRQTAGVAHGQIVLPQVQPGAQKQGDVGAIVDDEHCSGVASELRDALGSFKVVARVVALVPELQDAGAGFEQGFSGDQRRHLSSGKRIRVEDRVKRRKGQPDYNNVVPFSLHI